MERVPQFWTFIDEHLEQGNLRAPKMVYDELTDGNDHLAQWCKQRRKYLSVNASRDVQKCYRDIANWAHTNSTVAKAHEFLRGADGLGDRSCYGNGNERNCCNPRIDSASTRKDQNSRCMKRVQCEVHKYL